MSAQAIALAIALICLAAAVGAVVISSISERMATRRRDKRYRK